MISTEIQDSRAALFARTDTDTLLVSLLELGAIADPTTEQRVAHAWTADEIERRHPEITPLIEAAFDTDTDGDVAPYSQIVITAYAATRPAGA